jgi:phosphoglycolate phosphatase
MTYRLAIFDFDGTLADTSRWFVGALNDAADQFGFGRVSGHELEALRALDNRAIVARLGVPMWKMPIIARHIRARAVADCSGMRLFDGIGDMLRRCREADVALAIVSSNAEATVRRVLGPDLGPLVDHYACSVSLFGKAARIKRVASRACIPPAQVIAIGDEVRDIEAASAAGVASGAVAWGYAAPDLLRSRAPDLFFESVDDIVRVLAGARAPLRFAAY